MATRKICDGCGSVDNVGSCSDGRDFCGPCACRMLDGRNGSASKWEPLAKDFDQVPISGGDPSPHEKSSHSENNVKTVVSAGLPLPLPAFSGISRIEQLRDAYGPVYIFESKEPLQPGQEFSVGNPPRRVKALEQHATKPNQWYILVMEAAVTT